MLLRVLKDLASGLTAKRPESAQALYDAAVACHARGDDALALDYCARARRIAPELADAGVLQSRILLRGETYPKVLARIFGQLQPRTYVEIGIFEGLTLQLATPPTIAVGIDPVPRLTRAPAANHKVFEETSDAFFAGHDLRAELGGLPVDLAFIDGMHHFEYALRDFINLERYSTRNSVILVHDCYPLDRETAERAQPPGFWSGDIWRLIVLLKKYRPDLAVDTIGTAPTGLGVVRNLDPGSRVLQENYGRACEEFLALDYAYLDQGKEQKLNLFPNDPERIRVLLGGG